jgi:peptidoglycan/xylan/chitin deacetylase (PgdA/CDA1 family)
MSTATVALKVDVDTYHGTRDGVPKLLSLLEDFGIKATFYFSMGPDNTGKAVRRIFTRKGLLKKLLRTQVLTTYSPKTLLYGTLLPPPLISAALPDILLATQSKGHEVGIHGWDHVKWDDLLPWLPKPVTAMELGKAGRQFETIFGRRARTTAAPGWKVSANSLEVQDAMTLSYSSDCRGRSPFYPVVHGRIFKTLQIPTTWPTIDEIIGENGIAENTIHDHYCSLLQPGLNVHTIHAELEGGIFSSVLRELLRKLVAADVRFITLAEAAAEYGANAPVCTLAMGELPGRPGNVAIQGE